MEAWRIKNKVHRAPTSSGAESFAETGIGRVMWNPSCDAVWDQTKSITRPPTLLLSCLRVQQVVMVNSQQRGAGVDGIWCLGTDGSLWGGNGFGCSGSSLSGWSTLLVVCFCGGYLKQE